MNITFFSFQFGSALLASGLGEALKKCLKKIKSYDILTFVFLNLSD